MTVLRTKTATGPMQATRRSSPIVILFAKTPVAGNVKTRLARDIGHIAATMWYRRALRRMIGLAQQGGVNAAIWASPSVRAFRSAWPAARLNIADQLPGDLGRRMAGAARTARGASIITGSDIPSLSSRILRTACDGVRRFDAVFGPAKDGGYYLVGLKNAGHAFRLFDRIRWSSAHALEDTLNNAPCHWRIGFLPVLHDVDNADDIGKIQPPASALVRITSSPVRISCEAKSRGRTAFES